MAKILTARDIACPQCKAPAGVACFGTINNARGSIPVHHSLRRSDARDQREQRLNPDWSL